MENPDIEQNAHGATGFGRRRLLKGAAAAGVGVAAWSAPSISSLGGTPVYAASCTAGFVDYDLGSRNTNCNCNPIEGTTPTPNTTVARYKELGTACSSTPPFPGVAYMCQGGTADPITDTDPVTDSGSCPPGYETANGKAGDAGVCVSTANANLFCRTIVKIWQGGACGNTFTEYPGPIDSGTGFYPLPGISCQAGGNIFMSVLIRCSEERECLE